MTGTTSSLSAIVAPATIDDLFLGPLYAASVAAAVSRRVTISTKDFRIPKLTGDPSAAWVAEGAEITPSDATVAELLVTPSKLAGLSIISSELAQDSSPEAAQIIGDGLSRDCANKVDAAFFGNFSSPAPAGLGSLSGANAPTTVSASNPWANIDAFTEAQYAARNLNATVDTWVANPADALLLAKVKQASGSNLPLLQPDPTAPERRIIAGVPLLTSTAVTVGTVWGIPRDRAVLVVRDDTEIEADSSVFFTSDRIAVRARLRAGFAFPQPAAIVKIVKAA